MAEQTVRKTHKYKLKPTPEQERALDRTLRLCRQVYNAAIGERREAWQKCGVSVSYYQQKAELPDIKAAMPEYSEVNSQVLQPAFRTHPCCDFGIIASVQKSWAFARMSFYYDRLPLPPDSLHAR
jgi:alpha-ketoglutarate-dependent taurine dioxygenase